MKRHLLASVLLGAVVSLASYPAVSAEFEWNFFTSFGSSDDGTKLHREFAKDLEHATDGRLKVTVYAGGELPYKGPDVLRVLSGNQIQMGHMSVGFIAGDLPTIDVFSIPFECTSFDAFYDKIESVIEDDVKQAMTAKFDAIPLMNFVMPAQELWIDRPVNSLDDLKNTKIRAWNREQSEVMRMLGGTGTSITSAEVIPALQRGVVNGAFTAALNAKAWKLYEVVNYGYMLDFSLSHEIIGVNKDAFNALPEDMQSIVLEVSKKWLPIYRERLATVDHEAREFLTENGMTLQDPTDSDAQHLRELAAPIGNAWAQKNGELSERLLETVRSNCQ